MVMELSESVQVILEAMRDQFGDVLISGEDCAAMFNGKRATQLHELSDQSLLQVALLQYWNQNKYLKQTVELQRLAMESLPKGNRATRRKK